MKIAVISLIFAVSVFPQTPEQLQKKYGPPSSYTEIYDARPFNESTKLSATVTATYSPDRTRISGIKIDIYPSFVGFEDLPTPFTKEQEEARLKLLKEVLDEVVPQELRGKMIIAGFYSGASTFGSFEQYEKVRIFYSSGQRRYASVNFKEASQECREKRICP